VCYLVAVSIPGYFWHLQRSHLLSSPHIRTAVLQERFILSDKPKPPYRLSRNINNHYHYPANNNQRTDHAHASIYTYTTFLHPQRLPHSKPHPLFLTTTTAQPSLTHFGRIPHLLRRFIALIAQYSIIPLPIEANQIRYPGMFDMQNTGRVAGCVVAESVSTPLSAYYLPSHLIIPCYSISHPNVKSTKGKGV
jgi:hypothetical protein